MRALIVAAMWAVLLAGCAAKVVSSSPRSVIISAGDARVQEAQDMADKECAKNGRFAKITARPSPTSDQFLFDCVN